MCIRDSEQIATDVATGALVGDVDADALVRLAVGSHLGTLLLDGSSPDEAARRRTVAVLAALTVSS